MSVNEPPRVSLPQEVSVANLGLELFADAVRNQGAAVQQVDWRIPASGDETALEALELLYGAGVDEVEAANAETVRRLDEGVPQLVGVDRAARLVGGFGGQVLLHCGPALAWSEACDPLRRSLRASAVVEGWAANVDEADRLLAAGIIRLEPAYRYDVVLPMASSLGPSAPVVEVVSRPGGTKAFAPFNQGPGDTAWFGRDTPGAVDRLAFLRDDVGPMFATLLERTGPIDLFTLAAQGVQMGDDVHLRTQATTNLLLRNLLPHLAALPDEGRVRLAEFLSENHLFFLNLAMAAAKSVALWAEQVEGSSIVTTMCRNGTTYGIRVAGCDELFLGEAPLVEDALYYPDYGPEDGARDIGDSAILELVGLGGAAAAGSPAVAGFVGGRMSDAAALTEHFARVCVGTSSRFTLPTWKGGTGTPTGVDVRRVVELGATPKVTTGILHVSSGAGQIGGGVATAPQECFRSALLALAGRVGRP